MKISSGSRCKPPNPITLMESSQNSTSLARNTAAALDLKPSCLLLLHWCKFGAYLKEISGVALFLHWCKWRDWWSPLECLGLFCRIMIPSLIRDGVRLGWLFVNPSLSSRDICSQICVADFCWHSNISQGYGKVWSLAGGARLGKSNTNAVTPM